MIILYEHRELQFSTTGKINSSTMPSSKTMLIGLSLIFILNLASVSTADPFTLYNCLPDGNFTANSTYSTNLNLLLSSLTSTVWFDGFFSSSVGQNNNKVRAISLCRGDMLPDACRTCVSASVRGLIELCPLQKGAIGWYDNCFLKFTNHSIPKGTVETDPQYVMKSPHNISSTVNVTQFNQVLGDLMVRLKKEAAAGGSTLKFATGEATVTSFRNIYGLAQCTPDLTKESCSACLENAAEELPGCCNGLGGGRVLRPSCNLRYESGPFYESRRNDAPPPTAATKTGNGIKTTETVINAAVPAISVMLAVLLCY